MLKINVREARKQFSQLLDRAHRGEEIVVLRHGKPVATLKQAENRTGKRLPSLARFRQSIGESSRASVDLLREERDAR